VEIVRRMYDAFHADQRKLELPAPVTARAADRSARASMAIGRN